MRKTVAILSCVVTWFCLALPLVPPVSASSADPTLVDAFAAKVAKIAESRGVGTYDIVLSRVEDVLSTLFASPVCYAPYAGFAANVRVMTDACQKKRALLLDVATRLRHDQFLAVVPKTQSAPATNPSPAPVVQQTQEQVQKVNEVVGSGATIATPIGVAAAQQTAQKLKDAGLTDLETSIYTRRYGAQAEYDFVACAPFTRDIYPTLYCVNGDSGIDACTTDEANVSNKQEGALNPWPAAGSTAAQKEQYRANSNGLARVQYCAGNFHILEKRFSANITQDTMATLFAKLGRSYVKQTKPVWELGVKLQDIPAWADGLGNGQPLR